MKDNSNIVSQSEAYMIAQKAFAKLKSSIHILLSHASEKGLSNAELGRKLGIYQGHVGHEGHISRTLLEIMKSEGVVEQNLETKKWYLKK